MKYTISYSLLVLLLCLPLNVLTQTISKLQILYQAKQFFDLHDEVIKHSNDKNSGILFYRGAVANKFNKIKASITLLREFLNRFKDDSLRRDALELLADDYIKIYQYAQAAGTYKALLEKHRAGMKADKLADIENSYRLSSAARRIPPQTISFRKSSIIKGTRDQAGLLNIPVEINGQISGFVFDTGANISTVTETAARKLNLKIIDARISVGTSTDAKVESKLGVAKTLIVGNIVLRNTLFLVMPDNALFISPLKYQINGIVGFPVIEALRKFTINRRDEISISAQNGKIAQSEPNLCLDELLPLVSGSFNNRRMTFSLDTGAATTTLYPAFYKVFDAELIKKLKAQTAKIGGAGGIKEMLAYRLPDLNLTIAGKAAKLSGVDLLTEPINDQSRYFAGNIGQDVIKQFERMTIDFQSMQLNFE